MEDRRSVDNGLWLCQTCAKLIDSDELKFSVAKLQVWRHDAEAAAARALELRRAPATESEGVFYEAQRLMPDLILEMKHDMTDDASELVREFVLLPSENVVFGHTKPRFVYFETTHPNLQIQVDWLAEMGLVVDVTPRNTPIYRFTPEFAEWLRRRIQ
jgi:hypothetical protein